MWLSGPGAPLASPHDSPALFPATFFSDVHQKDLGLASRAEECPCSLVHPASVQVSGWVGVLQGR